MGVSNALRTPSYLVMRWSTTADLSLFFQASCSGENHFISINRTMRVLAGLNEVVGRRVPGSDPALLQAACSQRRRNLESKRYIANRDRLPIHSQSVGKHEKTLRRILSGASDRNIRFSDARSLLLSLGFQERIRGDHYIMTQDGVEEILNIQPRADGAAKPYQIRQVRAIIVRYKLGEDDEV